MNATRALIGVVTGLTLMAGPAAAESSSSFLISQSVVNAGGSPSGGTGLSSASFQVTMDSVGGGLDARVQTSRSFTLEGGDVRGGNAPPGEVMDLTMQRDLQTMSWLWEPASSAFEVYRDDLSSLQTTFGRCAASGVEATGWSDSSTPTPGHSFFYLVTGRNGLWEEGTKGHQSNGVQRPNRNPCP